MLKPTSYQCIESNLKIKVNQHSNLESESEPIRNLLVWKYRYFFIFFVLVGIFNGLVYIDYWFGKEKKIRLAINEGFNYILRVYEVKAKSKKE